MAITKKYEYVNLLDRTELKLFFVPEKKRGSELIVKQKLEELGYHAPKIIREKYHRPRVENHAIFYSVSYTEKGMIFLISTRNAAVDAEVVREYDAGICKLLGIQKLNNHDFFKFFTEREALLKLHNRTLCDINEELVGKTMTFCYKDIIITVAYE